MHTNVCHLTLSYIQDTEQPLKTKTKQKIQINIANYYKYFIKARDKQQTY